jgi:hypothetical protein
MRLRERQPAYRDTISNTALGILLAITFLFPILLCAVFFPTPSRDLREHINLGLTFPLHTLPNPPLQTWITGTIALSGARDSWLFVMIAQILNFIGLAYLVRTARVFIGEEKVLPLIIMFCGGLCYSVATLSLALNADQIQVPIAAGMFFHALAAARDNRWRDWLAFGALAGLAMLAKYSSAVLMAAMLCGAIYESSLRKIFRNGRLYAAGVLALSIAALNIVPELFQPDAVGYASRQFDFSASLQRRGRALGELVGSIFLYGCPVVFGLVVVAWRGKLRPSWVRDPWQTFVVTTALGVMLILFLMIAVGGLAYSARHGISFFGIWLLALVTVLTFQPDGVRTLANVLLVCWAVLVVASLIYSQVVVHTVLREPSPSAAKALRDVWDRQFACGPAYVIGDNRAARGIAIYFGRPVKGIGAHELGRSGWFDLEHVQRLGGIVVIAPDLDDYRPPALSLLVADSAKHQLSLPYRRTLSTRSQFYLYYLIAPRGC